MATQIVAASCHALGACRSSIKKNITSAALTAEINITDIVEVIGLTEDKVNPHVDVAVPSINSIQTASIELTERFIVIYRTKYKRGKRQIHNRSTRCQYVAPLS
jgi:hypothetical protein